METSSPLALHRPAAPFGKRDLFANLHVRLSPGKRNGSMSIQDQLNQESNCYFGMKPVHGSSPAGSLAADLCQNFTIGEDGSPRFPTPRRALFTSNHGVAAGRKGFSKAPPIPISSSPMPLDSDSLMQMTPVPKRTQLANQVDISSPLAASPALDDEMMLESPCPAQPAVEVPRLFSGALEKPHRRASLTRAKGYSFAAPPSSRFHAENQLPVFRFGETRLPAATSTLSVSDCFQDSPPQATAAVDLSSQATSMATATATAMATATAAATAAAISTAATRSLSRSRSPSPVNGTVPNVPIRSRTSLVSINSTAAAARSGSPSLGHGHHGHIRRTSSSIIRPRRYRRSLSMFENPIDIVRPKREEPTAAMLAPAPALQPSLLAAVMDTDECAPRPPVLPHFFPGDPSDCTPRIDRATLLRVLDGEFNSHFDNKLIIDCRFEYEYDGGHINEAINFNDKEVLASHLFGEHKAAGRTLIVLHCEYSAHRAPLMARHIRAEDRSANAESYPRLTFPELYILDGGYSGFFSEHPSRCYPQAYVEMDAAEHAFTCEREMGRLRQNRKGLHRAQTFAFGQQSQPQPRSQPQPQPPPQSQQQLSFPSLHEPSLQEQKQRFYQFNEFTSPIAPGRSIPQQSSPCRMMGASPILGYEHYSNNRRRMASY